jgi:elongation factor Ts
MNPLALSRADVDSKTIEKEMDIFRTQLRNEGKKDEIIEKILGGKMDKFYQENTLVEQSFIKDASKTIKDLLKEAGDASITGFVRMQLGEGQHQPAEAEAA